MMFTQKEQLKARGLPPYPETATILIVEDQPLSQEMMTELLEDQGYRVVSVGRGEDAFQWLDQVQLVLLDAMLPGRDGWDICREIKEKHDPLLPVIMVTARTAPDDVVRTFGAGADDYVPKPFHTAELTARIQSRLGVYRAELALQQLNRQLAELASQNYQLYEQASRDAEQRRTLLRELDHRVRNNLSVIMGLVSMERNRRPPRPAAEALASLENRLRSFLLVHESLRRQNYEGVPIRELAERMGQRLRNTIAPGSPVRIEVTGHPITVPERQGFALALVINELVSNSLRHAFRPDARGIVCIRILRDGGALHVEVSDDGIGYRGHGEDDSGEPLGSGRSIIHALIAGELGGRIEDLPTESGTRVRVTVPAAPAAGSGAAQDRATPLQHS